MGELAVRVITRARRNGIEGARGKSSRDKVVRVAGIEAGPLRAALLR